MKGTGCRFVHSFQFKFWSWFLICFTSYIVTQELVRGWSKCHPWCCPTMRIWLSIVDGSFHCIYRYLVTGNRCLGYRGIVGNMNQGGNFLECESLVCETLERETECFAHLSRKMRTKSSSELSKDAGVSQQESGRTADSELPWPEHCSVGTKMGYSMWRPSILAHCQTGYRVIGPQEQRKALFSASLRCMRHARCQEHN